MLNIKVERTPSPKAKPDSTKLGFGKHFTDHMFLMDYTEGKGWHDARIVPYGPIEMHPSAMVLHYGQEVFEGMKAYKLKDGTINLFRPEMNFKRMNVSNERLCIPQLNVDDMIQALKELVNVDSDWVPTLDGTSLYLRPFVFATEAALGVHSASKYLFVIVMSPVGAYYPEGINPVKIYVEDVYVRSTKGGMGFAKTGGNYASSIIAQKKAAEKGFTQVLWLDGLHRKYIEEVGTMNVFFIIGDEIITPALEGSILPGVTRDSCLAILRSKGMKVSERILSIDEVMEANKAGTLKEAFGTGTAAVVSPIGGLHYKGVDIVVNNNEIGPVTQMLYDTMTSIQYGKAEDTYGWIVKA